MYIVSQHPSCFLPSTAGAPGPVSPVQRGRVGGVEEAGRVEKVRVGMSRGGVADVDGPCSGQSTQPQHRGNGGPRTATHRSPSTTSRLLAVGFKVSRNGVLCLLVVRSASYLIASLGSQFLDRKYEFPTCGDEAQTGYHIFTQPHH